MKESEIPDSDESPDTELPGVRLRLALGLDVSDVALEERVLARTIDQIERMHEAADENRAVDRVASRDLRRDRVPHRFLAAACLVLILVIAAATWSPTPAMAVPPGLVYETLPENVISAPNAKDALYSLAEVAKGAPTQGSGPTQYVAMVGWSYAVDGDAMVATIRPFDRRFWIADDGSARAVERQGNALSADGTLDPSPVPPSIEEATDELSPGTFGTLSALPLDPDELRQQILEEREAECHREERVSACLMEAITNYATTYVLAADLNSAFWLMLAEAPHVYLLGETTDRMGRSAIAIASLPVETSFETTVHVLLLDPETGRVMGDERVTVESTLVDIDGPSVTSFTTITDARMVAEVGDS